MQSINDKQNKVCVAGHGKNFLTTTTTKSSTRNNARNVKNLDFSIIIIQSARNTIKSSKLISSNLRLSATQSIQQSRLTNTRKTNQDNSSIASLLDKPALTTTLSSNLFFYFFTKLSNLRFHQAKPMLRGLVVLSLGHGLFHFPDFLMKVCHSSISPWLI